MKKKTTKKTVAKPVKKTKPAKPVKSTKAVKPVKKAAKKPVKKVVKKTVDKAVKSVVKKTAKKVAKKIVKANPAPAKKKPETDNKKLTDTEIAAYRATLQMIRARLSGDVSMMTDAALNKNRMEASGDLSVMPIHMADVGTDNFEQEKTLSFMQSESGLLAMVEDALQRIDEGTYGICESCETRIPKVRLNFLPFASMCVGCAAIAQKEDM